MTKSLDLKLERLLEQYRAELVPLIHKRVPGATIYLFGSRARKDYHEGADIDIAISAPEQKVVDIFVLGMLALDLEDTMVPVEVDFVDFNGASEKFRQIVLREGIVWSK